MLACGPELNRLCCRPAIVARVRVLTEPLRRHVIPCALPRTKSAVAYVLDRRAVLDLDLGVSRGRPIHTRGGGGTEEWPGFVMTMEEYRESTWIHASTSLLRLPIGRLRRPTEVRWCLDRVGGRATLCIHGTLIEVDLQSHSTLCELHIGEVLEAICYADEAPDHIIGLTRAGAIKLFDLFSGRTFTVCHVLRKGETVVEPGALFVASHAHASGMPGQVSKGTCIFWSAGKRTAVHCIWIGPHIAANTSRRSDTHKHGASQPQAPSIRKLKSDVKAQVVSLFVATQGKLHAFAASSSTRGGGLETDPSSLAICLGSPVARCGPIQPRHRALEYAERHYGWQIRRERLRPARVARDPMPRSRL